MTFSDEFVLDYANRLIASSRAMEDYAVRSALTNEAQTYLDGVMQRMAALQEQQDIMAADREFFVDEARRLDSLARDHDALYPHAAAIHQALVDQWSYRDRLERERRVLHAHWEAVFAENKAGMDRMEAQRILFAEATEVANDAMMEVHSVLELLSTDEQDALHRAIAAMGGPAGKALAHLRWLQDRSRHCSCNGGRHKIYGLPCES
ncbi:unnamed protein product [Peniophora sp. CBMAI 1063]|nr:unnamed protein product [Peniophora sp. CBMAI 1063]